MQNNFVHLQCHSEYSLIDGILRIKPLLQRVAELEMPAVALTDVNNLFGLVKFYRAALKAGVKPIVGCELQVSNKDYPDAYWSILIYCQNQAGYNKLTRIITNGYLYGQYSGRPVISEEWLHEFHSDLIMVINPKDSQGDISAFAGRCQKTFTNRLYLGLTRIEQAEAEEVNSKTLSLASKLQLPVVALNAVCFLQPSDFEAHEARICIHDGVTLDDPRRQRKHTRQQFLRSGQEMARLFADVPSALRNTVELAKRCNLILELDKVHLPNFPVPEQETPEQILIKQAHAGLRDRMSDPNDKYLKRLELELEVINNMGFASYFLIVADFIAWSLANDVPVGPGRGSGAGSLVAYALKITNLDPLQYDLLFERFLNPERVSMPDFDIDFCMEGRDRVIEYVAEKYGRDRVSQIITYGTMAARAVIRDVGRVLGHPYGFVDKIAKLVPTEIGITLDKALEQEEALKELYSQEEDVRTLIELAKKLEGITRNVGKHAGGVVIAPDQLINFTPLYCEAGETQTITQFDKDDVESIGLVKFDFLGLRTLTIINWAVRMIRERNLNEGDADLDIAHIPLDDPKTFDLLQDVNTTAIFQLESRGMKDLIRRMQPDCFEDIVALVALFRPGPLQSGMVDDFIDRKLGKAAIEYPHPDLEPILKPTYGVILYQEQVMQIAQVLAGYTLGAADLLRRAMGKKKPEEMARQREIFTQGAVERGVELETATYIFDLMEKFAGYGFNKSHSAAYALVSYQTAWLKAHYPSEFMAAVLSADMAHTDKVVMFVEDCQEHNIKMVSPDINHSIYKFSVDSKNRIIYGLGAVKGVGESALENIISARQHAGKYKDLFDLCRRIDPRKVTRRVLESLINCGALDCFGFARGTLFGNLGNALQAADQFHKDLMRGQTDLFGDVEHDVTMQEFPDWSDKVRLAGEKSTLGLYLSGHPYEQYAEELSNFITHRISELHPGRRGDKQIIAGIVVAMRTMITKRGDKMAFVTIEDKSNKQEVAIFSDIYMDVRELLKKDHLLVIQGEAKPDEYTGGVRFRALKIMDLAIARGIYAKSLRLEVDAGDDAATNFVESLHQALAPHVPGNCYVQLIYSNKQSRAELELGDKWLVHPDDDLLSELESLPAEQISVEVCY